MPGFVIHIAVGKEYIKKHKNEIKNESEFFKGILAPDMISLLNKDIEKSKTHYGIWKNGETIVFFDKFFNDEKVDMNNDYWKGYFIHLLTDSDFYLKYFKEETLELRKNNDKYYYDYECLNKSLMKKYHIDNIEDENVTKCMGYINGTPKYLKEDKVEQFINDFSDISIEEQIRLIKKKNI